MKGRQRGRAPGPRGVAGVCTLTPGPDSLWTEIGVSVAAQLARPCTGRGRVFRPLMLCGPCSGAFFGHTLVFLISVELLVALVQRAPSSWWLLRVYLALFSGEASNAFNQDYEFFAVRGARARGARGPCPQRRGRLQGAAMIHAAWSLVQQSYSSLIPNDGR